MDGENLPTIIAEVDTEMRSIQAEMGTRAYWGDDAKQSRYRQLIERKRALAADAPPTIIQEDPLKLPSKAEFDRVAPGGDFGTYLQAMRHVADITFTLPDGELPAVVRSFEALPDEVVGAMVGELLQYRPQVAPCSPEGVAEFAKLPEGRVLTNEWGSDAGRNLAVVRERLFRVVDDLDERGVERFYEWMNGLSEGAASAIYRKLAA